VVVMATGSSKLGWPALRLTGGHREGWGRERKARRCRGVPSMGMGRQRGGGVTATKKWRC
jgi:hypothetical protein